MVIVQQLGKHLPAHYVAEPRVHLGAQVEIDVATFDQELADFDEYEVRVYDVRRGRRLVAAVEIISPANKDRSENRHQFTAKCAALLRQRVSLVLVDLVTVRNSNLYAELLDLIGERDPALGDQPPATYAAACRWRPRGTSRWLEVWNHPLALRRPLSCLPLWLTDELAIPLNLETSYEQTCRDLRIA
jgi:hypothetical protein